MGIAAGSLRHALRSARAAPGFTLVAALTLALGVGVNTAIFSLVRGVIFDRLPVRDPGEVVVLWSTQPRLGEDTAPSSTADFLAWRAATRSYAGLAAAAATRRTLTGRGEPRRIGVLATTADFLDVWGLEPLRSRGFLPGEVTPGAPRVALVSHGFWRRDLAGRDPLGEVLWLDRRDYTVVGILPPEVEQGDFAGFDVWVTLELDPEGDHGDRTLTLVTGRLRSGVPLATAQREIDGVAATLAASFPRTNEGWGVRVTPLEENLVSRRTRQVLLLLVLMVGAVLLVVCANVAGMFQARAAGRRKEIATRLALGARRTSLVGQLLAEGLVPALAAAGLGLAVARLLLVVLARIAGRQTALVGSAHIDAEVLLFTLALAAATPLVFALLPALRAARTDLRSVLGESAGTAGGRRGRLSRRLLVAGQLAMASTLLVVGGLLSRTLAGYLDATAGLADRDLVVLGLELPAEGRDLDAARRFYGELLERVRGLPGAVGAVLTSSPPLAATPSRLAFTIVDRPAETDSEPPEAALSLVSPGYFAALRIPVLRGRALAPEDREGTGLVALVSAAAAARYWPGSDPVGDRITLAGPGVPEGRWEIVGVVGDVARVDPAGRAQPQIYLPFDQAPARGMSLLVRGRPGDSGLADLLRREVAEMDPDLPVDDLRSMAQIRYDALAPLYAVVVLFALFAGFATFVAAVGLYGLVSYAVAARRREFGLRQALGAAPAAVATLVVREGIGLAGAGIAAGLAGAALAAQLLRGVVYGVSPWDPATFVATLAAMAGVALVAHLVPAVRAARLDPAGCLRTH